jgi:hypothetical protein
LPNSGVFSSQSLCTAWAVMASTCSVKVCKSSLPSPQAM